MKKLIFIYFLCLFSTSFFGQGNNEIVIGKIDSLHSKILNEQRKIWVHVPRENKKGVFGKKKYPVIYLLDGNTHFYSVVGMMKQLSSANGNTVCPKMIVVGIPNTNRYRDLTPTKEKADPPFRTERQVAKTGGGKNFLSFIEKELKPYIESKYPVESYSMFIGHSLGGLTVMNTLVEKPELFNAYVAIDPSMKWNNKRLLNKIKTIKFGNRYKNKSLFLGIANTMRKGMDTIRVKKDTTRQTRHIRSVLELNTVLKKKDQSNLSFKSKYYENDTHVSVPLITEYDALRYIFDFYQIKIDLRDYENGEKGIINEIKSHYDNVSKVFEKKIKPDERYINRLGYFFTRMKQFKTAEELFKLNVVNYPKSFNVYDSIGDLYVKMGEKEKAIKSYEKSISVNKDSYSKWKLKKLLSK